MMESLCGVFVSGSSDRIVREQQDPMPALRRKPSRNSSVIMQSAINVYLSHSHVLSEKGKIRESLNVLYQTVKLLGPSVKEDMLVPIVCNLVDYLRGDSRHKYEKSRLTNAYSCQLCHGLLVEPVTIACGHSYCKLCLLKRPACCNVCKYKLNAADFNGTSCNVLVCSLVARMWPDDVRSYELRKTGNCALKDNPRQAIRNYTEALQITPLDHVLFGNRSCAYQCINQNEEALKDSEEAIRLRPDWAKAYYRKATALLKCEQWEQSVIALLVCASLEGRTEAMGLHGQIASNLLHCLRADLAENESAVLKATAEESTYVTDESGLFCGPDVYQSPLIDRIVDGFYKCVQDIVEGEVAYERVPTGANISLSEFECTLCFHYLWHPVTTPCGHTFCGSCLDRSLDHAPFCPLCKSSLEIYLAERRCAVTEFLDATILALFPAEYADRKRSYECELNELAQAGTDEGHPIPIFVATVALPTISCPLHVYEARYRLMMRRCMEAGTREFGMCLPNQHCDSGFDDFGTMLEIRDIEFTLDGRGILNTVGGRRFKCLSKKIKDGYNTSTVRFIKDDGMAIDVAQLQDLHSKTHQAALEWFESIDVEKRSRIMQHYGPMPPIELNYWTKPEGPSWVWWIIAILPVEKNTQLRVVKESSLKTRLELLTRILRWVIGHQT